LHKKEYKLQLAGRIAMAVMLMFTAIGHFIFPEGMAAMIPSFFPFKKFTVAFTGILEILFAIGLLTYRDKKRIDSLVIIFFLLVLPVNIHAAIEGVNYQTGALDGPGVAYLWFRIPLQLFFIAWVYFSSASIRTIQKSIKTSKN
ncbi:MAG: hypothetical protein AAF223_03415, partial [Bacteroidota bacterium]